MPNNIVKSFSDKTGKSEEEVERLWNKSEQIVKKEYELSAEDEGKFYSLVTGILKNMLKIDENVKSREIKMNKFDMIVERYLRSVPADSKEVFDDGKAEIMIFSFDPNGVNTFRAAMFKDHPTRGIVEVNSQKIPSELIGLKVIADNDEEAESIRELAERAGGIEYVADDEISVLPNG
tara:strand:+ start:1464 stop:1997 length:534 start_codon:yes stop_codon:yes gene_type:complete